MFMFFSLYTESCKHIQFKKKTKMENLGIDPSASSMQSGRSTIWANPSIRIQREVFAKLTFFLH